MVLGFILLSSWILVQILGRVESESRVRGFADQNDTLRASAFQALEIVIGVLAEIRELDGALYSPAQGWGDPLAYAGFSGALTGTNTAATGPEDAEPVVEGMEETAPFVFPAGVVIDVTFRDESGRFPLNQTKEARWKLLFEAMDLPAADIATLTDCLLDWIDADDQPRLNGAESELYQRREPPYRAANGPLTDLYQLRLVDGFDRLFFDEQGFPNERFLVFAECVTLLDPQVLNYNTAPPLVLEVLAEERDFESGLITAYLTGPDGAAGTEDDGILRPGLPAQELPRDGDGKPLSFQATCRYLTLRITARSLQTTFHLAARLDTQQPPPDGLYPVTLLDVQTLGNEW